MWMVKIESYGGFFEVYVRKVVSYQRNKVCVTIIKDRGYQYKSEENARKAAEAFNGIIETV